MTNPFNVLVLHTHDAGRFIQPFGYNLETPNLQKLAEQGVLFRNCHAAGPTCSPSRAALWTGSYPHNNGMFGLSHREAGGFSLKDGYRQHLVRHLQKHGYFCALSGVQHIDGPARDWSDDLEKQQAAYGARIGFDAVLNAHDMQSGFDGWRHGAQRAVEFLNAAPQQPFLLQAGFGDPHGPFYDEPEDENPDYLQPAPVFPDTPETRKDMASYRRKVRRLDRRMGEVLEALEVNGLADNTLVIATTDHGIDFPEMKCTLKDYGTGVFLIMRLPRGMDEVRDKVGGVVDAMVSHMDLFPTICELLGIDTPDWVQGTSMLPLLRGEVARLHDELFTEVTYHAAYEPMRAIRTERWKYIRRFDDAATTVGQNRSMCRGRDLWLENGYNERPVEHEQLYDLMFDPQEMNNLADKEAYREIKAELAARLRRHMEDTDDPLMTGPVPVSPGGYTGRPGTINPGNMDEKVSATEWNRNIPWRGWE